MDSIYISNTDSSSTSISSSGIQTTFHYAVDEEEKNVIAPTLFFKYVKSKLTRIEEEKLRKQHDKLAKYITKSDAINQIALSERLAKELARCNDQLAAKACGFKYIIDREDIDRYICNLKDGVNAHLCDLENYPRIIENAVYNEIKAIVDKQLFDKYCILYLDYTTDQEDVPIKTVKERIIEKDPILFGYHSYDEDKLYFLLDWEDEWCDLTFDKLIDKLTNDDPEFTTQDIPQVSKKYVDNVIQRAKDNDKRYKDTTPSNYKQLADDRFIYEEEQINIFTRIKEWLINKWRN